MTNEQSGSRQPSHHIHAVVRSGDRTSWVKIGAAWPSRDKGGYNIVLGALPIDGHIVMRTPKASD